MFEEVYRRSIEPNSLLSGVNFWAWGGEGRPKKPMGFWKAGDDFIGDPPHEAQGWYSVFDNDSSTIKVIRKYTSKMDSVGVK
jgi:mannan endo-1,4-beta-mannosidase